MIYKSQRNFRRRVRTWDLRHRSYHAERHTEVVLRETWWLFGLVPLYSRETIEKTSL